ncbi:polysaccharide biosynthesis tyrosine autokinase [Subtercola sp. PAMC28395]|uniref:polysaccharide biosynthesis tyrosine autokinase n=1 Tax=Subtercola sp. PAMC28395 TaxID=2846775 RepID=UPI001C0CF134|nr:polysaccharide biosynthesis tyrosine autokinase [Subtercola sp. PAMC28395]QWT24871.1 polysaccharide biosynthesis tyrosine autokinase [Subtercola sp. PAMC28395]
MITIIGGLVAWGWTFTQAKVYQANSSGIVALSTSGDIGSTSVGDSLAKSKAVTYVGLGESRAVAQLVITNLGLKTSPEALVGNVTVTNVLNTPTLKVSAKAATAEGAKSLADAWITGISQQITLIETGQTSTNSDSVGQGGEIRLVPVESAVVPAAPIFPDVKLSTGVGLLIGLIAGLIYAFVRNLLDLRIRTADAIEKEFDLSVVGTLPRDKSLSDDKRILAAIGDTPDGNKNGHEGFALAEALRELRTNLQFMNVDDPPRIIVITSPMPNDGKSTVTANLAVTLAAAGQRVIVVDGDLRKPSVITAFGLIAGVGITDLLIGKAEIQDVLQPWGNTGNLLVLGAGSIPPNPSELLGSQGMKVLLRELSKDALVLVDAPPLLPVTDGAILAARADGAIIVVSAGKTNVDELRKSVTNIAKANGTTLGIVLNRVPTKGALGRSYGYYRGSYYGADSKTKFSATRASRPEFETEISNVVPIRTGTGSR